MSKHKTNLIIGANGGIATGLIHQLLVNDDAAQVVAVSRRDIDKSRFTDAMISRIHWLKCSQDDEQIAQTVESMKEYSGQFDRIFICVGQLHGETYSPEKRLEDLSRASLTRAFEINTIIPTLWLKQLMNICKGKNDCRIGIISARVGSIEDNRLGGWYSYRASKAALNMLIKTAAIEYARRAKNVKLAALHPGTVDTDLSRPFQDRVPENKLFKPDRSAAYLIEQLDATQVNGESSFIAWDGEEIPW